MLSIKQGDLRPYITGILKGPDGAVIDLAAASGVSFRFRDTRDVIVAIEAAAVIVDAAAGSVRYEWAAGNTSTVGEYRGEWIIDWGGEPQTLPSNGVVSFQINNVVG